MKYRSDYIEMSEYNIREKGDTPLAVKTEEMDYVFQYNGTGTYAIDVTLFYEVLSNLLKEGGWKRPMVKDLNKDHTVFSCEVTDDNAFEISSIFEKVEDSFPEFELIDVSLKGEI